ncbi:hypothetical protein [Treponema sp.]|uniref:hypothetical protein n=1 Tax=Treponema sp. TaxID=166 RepID=UPI00389064D3
MKCLIKKLSSFTGSMLLVLLFAACSSESSNSVYEEQEHDQVHTNVFKTTAVFTPSKEKFLDIYRKYLSYGSVNIQSYTINTVDNTEALGPINFNNKRQIRSNYGYYVDNVCLKYPDEFGDVSEISVLPNGQVYIKAFNGNYIKIAESENASSITDLITISHTLPLDESKYELDEHTNEYVRKGHKSKQCIESGYHRWISTSYSMPNWVWKEISFDDIYQKIYSTNESPVTPPTANTIEDKLNCVKNDLEKIRYRLINADIFFTYDSEQLKFWIKANDGYFLQSNYDAIRLDETINRISCEDLKSTVIIPRKGYVLKKSELNLSADNASHFRGTEEIILKSINSENYDGKAVLYTKPENGEICYLVY